MRYQRGPLISKLSKSSKLGIQIFHMRFKIKILFENYRLFNIAEHISSAQNKTEKYFLKSKGHTLNVSIYISNYDINIVNF